MYGCIGVQAQIDGIDAVREKILLAIGTADDVRVLQNVRPRVALAIFHKRVRFDFAQLPVERR